MTRNLGLTILTSALLVAFLSAADDAPAKADKEPAKKQQADPAAKDAKPGEEPMPAAKAESPEEIIKRLRDEFDDAGTNLEKKDPGEKTRTVQKQIIDDLDKLINQQNNQSCKNPSNSSSSSSADSASSSDSPSSKPNPMGGSKDSPSQANSKPNPMGGQDKKPSQANSKPNPMGGQDKKPQNAKGGQGEPKKKQEKGGVAKNKSEGEKKGKSTGGGGQVGKDMKKNESNKNADLYREAWGHLPQKKRQEIDVYASDRTMSKYEQFQLRYTGKVLEQRRKKEGD